MLGMMASVASSCWKIILMRVLAQFPSPSKAHRTVTAPQALRSRQTTRPRRQMPRTVTLLPNRPYRRVQRQYRPTRRRMVTARHRQVSRRSHQLPRPMHRMAIRQPVRHWPQSRALPSMGQRTDIRPQAHRFRPRVQLYRMQQRMVTVLHHRRFRPSRS